MTIGAYTHRNDCRGCNSTDLVKVLSLGNTPLAGGYLHDKDVADERVYPLDVYFCRECGLVQLLDIVPNDVLFKDYRYLSSVMTTLRRHFEEHAKDMAKRILPRGSFVVEIGSNDGVLLKPLKDLGMKPLGFEPATNIAAIAIEKGLDVINDFFNEANASDVARIRGKAKAILANNVFAHNDDIDELMKGVVALLADDGQFIFEVHYIADILDRLQYDTIYHEHFCYYSLTSLSRLLARFGLDIMDAVRIPIHCGSIRVYAAKAPAQRSARVQELRAMERAHGIDKETTYHAFAERVRQHRDRLVSLLQKLKADGKSIAGYGASGRRNTLLNYCGIGKDVLDYVTDESPERYGRLIPGMHIPIVQVTRMRDSPPDYALMLAWSYFDEIMAKERRFVQEDGKFIVPLPDVLIVP